MAVVGISPARPRGHRLAWAACNTLQLIFTIVWTIGCITLALLVLLATGSRRLPLRMASRLWAPGLLFGAGARLQVEGLERVDFSQPHVFVANHRSIIDVCALFRALPVPLRFVIKQEIATVPFVGWYARAMGMVFIERGHAREAAHRLHDIVAEIRGGASLCAFPEGTRNREGTIGPFKGGAFQVALLAGVPVVPIAISGSGEVLPPSGFRVRPGTIRVCIGDPLPTAALAPAARHSLARRAREAVVEMSAPGCGKAATRFVQT